MLRLIQLFALQWWPAIASVLLVLCILSLCQTSRLVRLSASSNTQLILDFVTLSSVFGLLFGAFLCWVSLTLRRAMSQMKLDLQDCEKALNAYSPKHSTDFLSEMTDSVQSVIKTALMMQERENVIADHSLDFLCAIDQGGLISAANQASFRLLGVPPYQLVGKDISALISANDVALFRQALQRAATTGDSVEVVAEAQTHGVEPKIFLWTVEFSSTHGTYFCAGQDVTAKMQLERFKQEFTAMVVHDLRSPVTSCVMTLDSVLHDRRNALCGDHQMKLARSHSGLQRLLRLINSLLDLSKLESGKFKLQVELTRVSRLLRDCVDTVESFAEQSGVSIKLSGDLDEKVAVDSERIAQVLVNLTSNAVKYSPRGSTVAISAHKTGANVTIVVSDQGPGIPEENRSRIFGKYEQAAAGEVSGTTGLGLFISKAIVERHGGSIGVRSSVGSGSQFWFTVPGLSTDVDPDLD